MDPATVAVYQRSADEYGQRRRASRPDRARSFAAALPAGGLRLDLGCGPGFYLPHLGRPVVAADAALAMVASARDRHPDASGVVCDLEALPVRRATLAGVWASKSLQHVAAERLPLTLAGVHRALRLRGLLDLTVFLGDGTERTGSDDEFPGRWFTWWHPEALGDLLVGAGFEIDQVAVEDGAEPHRPLTARARRARTLPDTVGPGMRLLICGLNPSLYAADAGVGFARPGNRFWPAALEAGIVSMDRDPDHALVHHGVGMTDLVKRATVAADELRADEYRAGLTRIERLVRWLRPAAVCFVGLAGWRAAVDRRARPGFQPRDLAGVPVYVMPSTSGLNASTTLVAHVEHLRAAAGVAAEGSAATRPSDTCG